MQRIAEYPGERGNLTRKIAHHRPRILDQPPLTLSNADANKLFFFLLGRQPRQVRHGDIVANIPEDNRLI